MIVFQKEIYYDRCVVRPGIWDSEVADKFSFGADKTEMMEGILFDLDGTLWDATEAISKTWSLVLAQYPRIKRRIAPEDLYGCMGLPLDAIGDKLFPDLEEARRRSLMEECCILQNRYLEEHGGNTYPGLEETVAQLAENFKLFIVSNCGDGYIQSFLKAHRMDRYFSDFESAGATNLSKGENNTLIMKRNHITKAVYVGDTAGDAESARLAGIPFIYARYGFGRASEYDYAIEKLPDLLRLEWINA